MRQEADSDLVLAQALKKILPPYRGDGLRLYRGESMFNRRRHTYGLSWTSDIEVAKSFAEGIYQTFDSGSVLLQTDAPASAIICIPKQHTAWRDGESEYLVDRRKLTLVTVLELYVQRDLNSP